MPTPRRSSCTSHASIAECVRGRCAVNRRCQEQRLRDCTTASSSHAEMAFLPFEQVYGSSSSGTYQHTPDPTAKDPESGKQQFVCASAKLPVLLACPCIKLMLPAPHLYPGAQASHASRAPHSGAASCAATSSL
jgi:hypothetical protein